MREGPPGRPGMSATTTITLPLLRLRTYQKRIFEFFAAGGRRAVVVAHRRSGKDCAGLNWMVSELWQTPGIEGFYVLPTFTQAKRVLWHGLTDQRRKMLDFIPPEIIATRNEAELRIVLRNRSQLSFVGSEQLDALMGSNPSRLVFSEYALQRPDAWDFLRPILTQNGGKVLFLSTPRGRNHLWTLFSHAERDPSWYAARLTVADTRKDASGEDGAPVISEESVDKERLEGMPENLIAQEFFCSFAEAVAGGVYARELAEAEAQGRVGPVPHLAGRPVIASWDIGAGVTAITVAQTAPPLRICVVDYIELDVNASLPEAVRVLAQKPYVVGEHIFPHDFRQAEWASERSRVGTARSLGLRHLRVLPRLPVEEGIHAAKMLLARCWFDERNTRDLVAALAAYKREWDETRKVFSLRPSHEWCSHGADSFRYLALGLRARDEAEPERPRQVSAHTSTGPNPFRSPGPEPARIQWPH
jgi:phage terminase large subunit